MLGRPDTRQTTMVNVDFIEVEQRHRSVSDDAVKGLADSMREIGMRTPISVRYFPDRPGNDGSVDSYVLVTGAHRLAAARKNGWQQVECFVVDCDEIDAELWEIAENLHRAELTQLERDEQVARWLELSAVKVSRQLDAKPQGGRPAGGTRAAAREIGVSEPDARRAVKVAGLSSEAKQAARDAGLDDNRSALLKAAKAPVQQQPEIFRRIAQAKEVQRHNRDHDRAIKLTAAEEYAEWLMERADLDELPMLISWLEAVANKDVIAALRRAAQ